MNDKQNRALDTLLATDAYKLDHRRQYPDGIDGVGHDILKDPVTDDGSKKSATGRLAVRRAMSGEPYLIEHADADQEADNELKLVFEDGKLLRQYSFTEVRETLTRETGVYQRYSHSRRQQP